MNKTAALAEAKRRWGPLADVKHFPTALNRHTRYRVDGGPFKYMYSGCSWSAAFAEADQREKETPK